MAWNRDSIIHLATVDSTNRYLRDESCNLWSKRGDSDFIVVTAEHQTAGRGQRGNSWCSNAGENLLFSILVRPGDTLAVAQQFHLSQAVALALSEAMQCYGISTQLKWPNDIYVGKRKLAGILLEIDYSGAFVEEAIIGIGINVNQEQFPIMDKVPVSMKMLAGKDFALDKVLTTALNSFERYYNELRFGNKNAIAEEYEKRLLGINELRTFIDKEGQFEAVIQGVESDGHLLLLRNDGSTRRHAFKEVEILL